MGSMVKNNIAFYGSRNEIVELMGLLNIEGEYLFSKINPIPSAILRRDKQELLDWKLKYWGTPWCRKISSEISHKGNYSIFRFEFECPYQQPHGILRSIYKKFNMVKSVSLTEFEADNSMMVVRRDPQKGFQKCIQNYPDGSCQESSVEVFSEAEVADDFLMDLKQNSDLSDALKMIGIDFPEMA